METMARIALLPIFAPLPQGQWRGKTIQTVTMTDASDKLACRPRGGSSLLRHLFSAGCDPAQSTPDVRRHEMRSHLVFTFLALLPALACATFYLGSRLPLLAIVAAATALLCELMFALVRHKPGNGGGIVYALLLVLMVPATTPIWMIVLGTAVGTVFAKEVFGGTGSHLFCPALVGKAFLVFSYPLAMKGPSFSSMLLFEGDPNAWLVCSVVIILCALPLVAARRSNVRIIGAALLGAVCAGIILQQNNALPFDSILEMFGADSLLFGACLLVCDPATSPRDDEAKWLHGLMIGVLAVFMRAFSTYTEAMMSAVLIANVFAPTLDILAGISLSRRAEP